VETEPNTCALGDHERILQVLTNLVTNAVQHTDEAGRIVLSSERRNGHVVLSVTDDGRGISPHELPHVFERLYRGKSARAVLPEGSGLGLAIASSLTAAMGGTIDVGSAPGEGATFTVSLPAA
jgi:signal transduction histidine kinase